MDLQSFPFAQLSPTIGAVWWIKRDLRVFDNPALTEAAARAEGVGGPLLPLFLWEPTLLAAPEASAFHAAAQYQALASLRHRLQTDFGTDILVGRLDAVAALESLFQQHPFTQLVSHRETGTEVTYSRDRAVAAWCQKRGVLWTQPPQTGVFRPLWDRDDREALWAEFMKQTPLPAPTLLPQPAWLRTLCETAFLPPAFTEIGERQETREPLAWATLRGFLRGRAAGYSKGISSPLTAFKSGSRLSVHLAWGTISARAVAHETQRRLTELAWDPSPEARDLRLGLRSFSERLHWRDHFAQRLEDEPGIEFQPPHPLYADLPCVESLEADVRMAAFLAGKTGFPLIDACVRCASATGFLNFRMRALVTSFACHGLRLPWQDVLAPLARLWTDYEPGIHVSQIQMQAGVVGTNTIRVYSPAKQLRDQDPDLEWTRTWLPELRDAPAETVLHLGEPNSPGWPGYAAPLVDFAAESKQMKDILYGLRDSPEGIAAAKIVQKRHGSRRSRPRRPARKCP